MQNTVKKISSYDLNSIHNVETREVKSEETELDKAVLFRPVDESCHYNVTLEFSDTEINPDEVREIRAILKDQYLKKFLIGASQKESIALQSSRNLEKEGTEDEKGKMLV